MSLGVGEVLDIAGDVAKEAMYGPPNPVETATQASADAIQSTLTDATLDVAEKIPVVGNIIKKGVALFDSGKEWVGREIHEVGDDIKNVLGITPDEAVAHPDVDNAEIHEIADDKILQQEHGGFNPDTLNQRYQDALNNATLENAGYDTSKMTERAKRNAEAGLRRIAAHEPYQLDPETLSIKDPQSLVGKSKMSPKNLLNILTNSEALSDYEKDILMQNMDWDSLDVGKRFDTTRARAAFSNMDPTIDKLSGDIIAELKPRDEMAPGSGEVEVKEEDFYNFIESKTPKQFSTTFKDSAKQLQEILEKAIDERQNGLSVNMDTLSPDSNVREFTINKENVDKLYDYYTTKAPLLKKLNPSMIKMEITKFLYEGDTVGNFTWANQEDLKNIIKMEREFFTRRTGAAKLLQTKLEKIPENLRFQRLLFRVLAENPELAKDYSFLTEEAVKDYFGSNSNKTFLDMLRDLKDESDLAYLKGPDTIEPYTESRPDPLTPNDTPFKKISPAIKMDDMAGAPIEGEGPGDFDTPDDLEPVPSDGLAENVPNTIFTDKVVPAVVGGGVGAGTGALLTKIFEDDNTTLTPQLKQMKDSVRTIATNLTQEMKELERQKAITADALQKFNRPGPSVVQNNEAARNYQTQQATEQALSRRVSNQRALLEEKTKQLDMKLQNRRRYERQKQLREEKKIQAQQAETASKVRQLERDSERVGILSRSPENDPIKKQGININMNNINQSPESPPSISS